MLPLEAHTVAVLDRIAYLVIGYSLAVIRGQKILPVRVTVYVGAYRSAVFLDTEYISALVVGILVNVTTLCDSFKLFKLVICIAFDQGAVFVDP